MTARGLSGNEVSLREIITPQRMGNTPQIVLRTWQNWLADHTVRGADNFLPETAEQVRSALLSGLDGAKHLRATGSGHSHSAAAKPHDAMISLGGLDEAIRDMSVTEIMTNQIVGVAEILREHMRDIRQGSPLFEALGDLVRGRSPAEVAEAVTAELMRSGDADLLREATTLDPAELREKLVARLSGGCEGLLDDGGWLKDAPPGLGAGEAAVRVAAGTTLKRLNRVHLTGQDPALALRNMGSFDGQTLAGAINTGTHGTGMRLATMADDVLSAELVCVTRSVAGEPLVRQFRIEPADGPTDPERFEADAPSHATNLIQDDEIFRAAVCGYGAFGIATAYTMRVRNAYWLQEETTLEPWSRLKPRLDGPTRNIQGVGEVPIFTDEARHVSFWFNVAQLQEDDPVQDPDCMILKRSIPEPPVPEGEEPKERTRGFSEWIGSAFQDLPIDPQDPDPAVGTVGKNVRNYYFEPRSENAPFGGSARSAYYISLRRERDGTHDPYQPPEPPPLAISMEVAVSATEVVRAMELIFGKVAESEYFFPVPIGVRFVAPSTQFLAPQHDRPSALIEIPFPISVILGGNIRREARDRRRDEVAKDAFQPILDALRADPVLEARPHLGKVHGLDAASLARTFPEVGRWKAVRARFDPFGTFDNAFTRELGL